MQLREKIRKRHTSESESEEPDENQPPVELVFTEGMGYDMKRKCIEEALPFDSNVAFLTVIDDPEGSNVLRDILDEEIRGFFLAEQLTLDTSDKTSRVLESRFMNFLFSRVYLNA